MSDVLEGWFQGLELFTLQVAYRLAHPTVALGIGQVLEDRVRLAEAGKWRGIAAPIKSAVLDAALIQRACATGPRRLGTALQQCSEAWHVQSRQTATNQWHAYQPLVNAIWRGLGNPARIRALPHRAWKRWQEWVHLRGEAEIERAIDTLRKPEVRVAARIDAMRELFAAEDPDLVARFFPLFGNVSSPLMSRLFEWPLLVADVDAEPVGVSLPLALDVSYPTRIPQSANRDATWGHVRVAGGDPGHAEAWLATAEKSYRAAFFLWRARHTSQGHHRQTEVAGADVSLDLALAERLLNTLYRDAGFSRPALTTESAEAALAIAITSRHLGESLSSATGVTGTIGAPRMSKAPPRDAPRSQPFTPLEIDYDLGPVGDLPAKTVYAATAGVISRLVSSQVQEVHADHPPLELPVVTNLAGALWIVRGDQLSPRRVVRVPELILKSREIAPPATAVTELIRASPVSVLALNADLRTVMASLHQLDKVERWGVKPIPPSLQWVVIRASGLLSSEFWTLFWSACDGEEADLVRLLGAPSVAAAASIVETVLNRPHAPDLVIILGDVTGGDDERADRPLAPQLVLQQVVLRPNRHHSIQCLIGVARVISLPDPGYHGCSRPVSNAPCERLTDAESVEVFRLPIDRTVLTRFLRDQPDPAGRSAGQRIAELLRTEALIKARWKLWAPRRNSAIKPATAKGLASAHLSAALALVPALRGTGTGTVDLDRVSLESHVEAAWHLRRSNWLAMKHTEDRDWQQVTMGVIRHAQRLLLGFYLPACWEYVLVLARHKQSELLAEQIANELLDQWPLEEQPPLRLLLTSLLRSRGPGAAGGMEASIESLRLAAFARLDGCTAREVAEVIAPLLGLLQSSDPLRPALEARFYAAAQEARDGLDGIFVAKAWVDRFVDKALDSSEASRRRTMLVPLIRESRSSGNPPDGRYGPSDASTNPSRV